VRAPGSTFFNLVVAAWCRVRDVTMPGSDRSKPLGRSSLPAARDRWGLGRRGRRQPAAPGSGVAVAGSLLTVKIRQPSHEFTFGVGISFIPYPLVLTPVV
jgi:hypothetical protein